MIPTTARQLTNARELAVKTVNVNRFEIPTYSLESPPTGSRLVVHLNAMRRVEEPRTRRVDNPEYSAEAAAAAREAGEPYEVEATIEESYLEEVDRDITNLEPEVFTGEALDAVFEDALDRAPDQAKLDGVNRGMALRRALKLAMYAALEGRGRVPAGE